VSWNDLGFNFHCTKYDTWPSNTNSEVLDRRELLRESFVPDSLPPLSSLTPETAGHLETAPSTSRNFVVIWSIGAETSSLNSAAAY
jgi:hypothetical protein